MGDMPAGLALHKLAKLYEASGQRDQAAECHQANLEVLDAQGALSSDSIQALLFLATWHKVWMSCC